MATNKPAGPSTELNLLIADTRQSGPLCAIVRISGNNLKRGLSHKIRLLACSSETSADRSIFKEIDDLSFAVRANQRELIVIHSPDKTINFIEVEWDGTTEGLNQTVKLDRQFLWKDEKRIASTSFSPDWGDGDFGVCVKIGRTHYTNCPAATKGNLGPEYRYVDGKMICEYLLGRKSAGEVQKAATKSAARRDELKELRERCNSLIPENTTLKGKVDAQATEIERLEDEILHLREKIQETETWNITFQRRLAIGDDRRDKIRKIVRIIQPRRFMPTLRWLQVLNTVQNGLNMIDGILNGEFDDKDTVLILDGEVV